MATKVSSVMRLMNGGDVNDSAVGGGKSRAVLVTRDLLDGYCTVDSKELDLDLQVPSGFEKRLDMKSGKLYLHKCNSQMHSSSSSPSHPDHKIPANFVSLNYPPGLKQPVINLLDDDDLDLKLVLSASSSSSPSSNTYQSVCTLDKVKSALDRAEKETNRKRSLSSASPSSHSSSSMKDSEIDQEDHSPASFATSCPSCLIYVLISKTHPKCPRCKTVVSSPPPLKKPRIDLNISI